MRTLRIDHVTVVSPDAPSAAATFERLFALPRAAATPRAPTLTIGDARIEFVTPAEGSPLAEALRTGGEGMAALTLTVADLDEAARTLAAAGVGCAARTDEHGRRVLDVDPRSAHGVRLMLASGA